MKEMHEEISAFLDPEQTGIPPSPDEQLIIPEDPFIPEQLQMEAAAAVVELTQAIIVERNDGYGKVLKEAMYQPEIDHHSRPHSERLTAMAKVEILKDELVRRIGPEQEKAQGMIFLFNEIHDREQYLVLARNIMKQEKREPKRFHDIGGAAHVLVHYEDYRDALIAQGKYSPTEAEEVALEVCMGAAGMMLHHDVPGDFNRTMGVDKVLRDSRDIRDEDLLQAYENFEINPRLLSPHQILELARQAQLAFAGENPYGLLPEFYEAHKEVIERLYNNHTHPCESWETDETKQRLYIAAGRVGWKVDFEDMVRPALESQARTAAGSKSRNRVIFRRGMSAEQMIAEMKMLEERRNNLQFDEDDVMRKRYEFIHQLDAHTAIVGFLVFAQATDALLRGDISVYDPAYDRRRINVNRVALQHIGLSDEEIAQVVAQPISEQYDLIEEQLQGNEVLHDRYVQVNVRIQAELETVHTVLERKVFELAGKYTDADRWEFWKLMQYSFKELCGQHGVDINGEEMQVYLHEAEIALSGADESMPYDSYDSVAGEPPQVIPMQKRLHAIQDQRRQLAAA